jgi:hypothetical protein
LIPDAEFPVLNATMAFVMKAAYKVERNNKNSKRTQMPVVCNFV